MASRFGMAYGYGTSYVSSKLLNAQIAEQLGSTNNTDYRAALQKYDDISFQPQFVPTPWTKAPVRPAAPPKPVFPTFTIDTSFSPGPLTRLPN